MSANEYHFITHWTVNGTTEEVAEILGDAVDLARWWPSVYLDVRELAPGDERSVGRTFDLFTKGFLPYTLRWQLTVTESDPPRGFSLDATGDFVGRGIWTFEQRGEDVDVTYDWKLRADKPLLSRLSFLLKPVFAANHRWAMAKGEQSLRLELARRHARTAEERNAVAEPPGSTGLRGVSMVAGAAAGALGLGLLLRRIFRRRD